MDTELSLAFVNNQARIHVNFIEMKTIKKKISDFTLFIYEIFKGFSEGDVLLHL